MNRESSVAPIQLSSETEMKLQDLNEQCLLEILSSKSLTRDDLSSLAQTCKLFKGLIQRIFVNEFEMKIGYNERDYKFTSNNHSECNESVQDVERILRNCGQNLSSLIIHRNNSVVNDLIAKYCGAGTLKRLELFTLKCTADLKVKFSSIYRHLLVLSIRECIVYKNVTVQQFNCNSLVELNIVNVQNCCAILENTFPNLERLTFEQIGCDGRRFTYGRSRSDGREILLAFIGRHTTLKTIKLDVNFEFRIQSLVHSIDRCTELEELVLRNFYSSESELDCTELEGMTKLRTLDVDIGDSSNYGHLISLLKVFKGIETFKLSTGGLFYNNDCGFLLALARLKNLRKLYLTNCPFQSTIWTKLYLLCKLHFVIHTDPYHGTYIQNIISQLSNLEELRIDAKREGSLLSERDFYEIVRTVARRSNVLTLKCRFNFSENFVKDCNQNGKINLIKLE